MKKSTLVVIIIALIIGGFLQKLLIDTSPRIHCDEISKQMWMCLRTLAIEFGIITLIMAGVNKYSLRLNVKQSLAALLVFAVLYFALFGYLFIDYAGKCMSVN